MTVFSRNDEGQPIIWNYQIKGFFKEACAMLQRMKGENCSKESCKLKAYKKIIDGCIEPAGNADHGRQIPIIIAKGTEIEDFQRPLRAQTAQGERITLAHSETIPAGSTIEFTVICLSDAHVDAVKEWLDYGRFKGLGQWRNSGKGRFQYELVG